MVCLTIYPFKFFQGFSPQNLLSPLLNTLSHLLLDHLFSFEILNVLFEVIRLLKLVSLLSKSVLVTKLSCFNLAVKFPAFNLLNSGVVIYLS